MVSKVLDINNLSFYYKNLDSQSSNYNDSWNPWVTIFEDISIQIDQGSIIGIAGKSGCGKTTLAKTIMQLLPPNGFLNQGEIFFKGKDLTLLSDSEIRAIRWKEIAIISRSIWNIWTW